MREKINNRLYEDYQDKWYHADDDPVALLRAEGKLKNRWIKDVLEANQVTDGALLDIACGGGFLPNFFAELGYDCHGVDIYQSCLDTAKKFDQTQSVAYRKGDAHKLPYDSESFDIVCVMDFLEHTSRPELVVREALRVLKKDGHLFFHTFNRNLLSWLLIIKLVEWAVPNTPEKMHVIEYFIRPNELKQMLRRSSARVEKMTGIRPVLWQWPLWRGLWKRRISDDFAFKLTPFCLCSYMGHARKL